MDSQMTASTITAEAVAPLEGDGSEQAVATTVSTMTTVKDNCFIKLPGFLIFIRVTISEAPFFLKTKDDLPGKNRAMKETEQKNPASVIKAGFFKLKLNLLV